ncbi:MAG TPA: sulfotransferase [Rhizomicrobium sp.]|nr:sulfotransferase [Rhizomicrobium sp.]
MTEALETAVARATELLQRAQTTEAVALARECLDRGVEAPLLLNLRAYWLEGQNRPVDALKDLQRAHELAPSDPMVLNALGLCLAKLGRLEEAVAAFRKCSELAPDFAPAHYNCGWSLEELGELDRARDAFLETARLNPQAVDPLGRLAALAARRGQWQNARTYAQRALALAPDNAPATIALASADLAAKDYRSARQRLGALIESPRLTDQDRGTIFGLLGDALDAEGRYDDAFAAYTASNTTFKSVFAGRLAATGEMPMDEYVGWLLQHFEDPATASWQMGPRNSEDGPARHLFILGFPRSGTTLLEEILACHPDVITTGEKDALSGIVRELLGGPQHLAHLQFLDAREIAQYRKRYWDTLASHRIDVENRILVDKQPFNTIRLPLIAKLFPEARIIFCLRDPRDVVLSCFRRRLNPNAANAEFLSLDRATRLYDMVARLAAAYRRKIALPVHEIKNEDLVSDFDSRMRELCAFAGIEWTDAFRDFAQHSAAREVSTPSATQVIRGLGSEGIGHWRNYRSHMASVLPSLNDWAERFGYKAAGIDSQKQH